MVVTTEIGAQPLAELIKQVQAGNEVLLTQGDKAVARLVPPHEAKAANGHPFHVRSFKGHRVLAPVVAQDELAEEMFGRQ